MEILVVPHTHFVVHFSCYPDDVLVSPDDQQDNLNQQQHRYNIRQPPHPRMGYRTLIASSFMRFIDDDGL